MTELNFRLNLAVTPGLFRWGLALLSVTAFATDLSSESVVLTTYYPAPTGIYTQLITTTNTYVARDAAGNVGIGITTLPTAKLELNGNTYLSGATPTVTFGPAGGPAISGPAAATLAVSTLGAERMRIDATGRVGIGTNDPRLELDVNGDLVGRTWYITLSP